MRSILSLLAIVALATGLNAQVYFTIHGHVSNISNNQPIPNHVVYILADSGASGFQYYSENLTNTNGYYADTILVNNPATPIAFIVKTFDCYQQLHSQVVYTSNGTAGTEVNFSICDSTNTGCEADFTYYADSVNFLHVHFYDASFPLNLVTTREWCFGDPGSGSSNYSNSYDPWHIFSAPGTYQVCLTIHTSTGCTSTHCEEIEVGEPGTGCHAAFTAYFDSVPNNLTVFFQDQSTGNPTSWEWHFGDGTFSTEQNPHHTYNAPGYYSVCLSIGALNCQDTKCDTLVVGTNPSNCENWITYTKEFLTVSFEGHCYSPFPVTYTWQLGDPASTTLTGQNVTFTYPAPGSYTVTLVTQDTAGCSWTRHQTIWVSGTCDLWGMAYAMNSYVDHAEAVLYKMETGAILPVDTVLVSDSGGMYWFGGVTEGTYYIKITLLPNSVFYGQYVPTYYHHSSTWGNANVIALGPANNPYNTEMVHVPGYTAGSGNINGVITQGNKVNGNGTPVPGVEVMVLDPDNLPLGFTTTDAEGNFSFPAIAMGTYTIYPEVTGKTTVPAHITLTGTEPTATLTFTMHEGSVVFGINEKLPAGFSAIGPVFPNPVRDKAMIDITANKEIQITLSLFDPVGKLRMEKDYTLVRGSNRLTFGPGDLSGGVYFLRITSAEGGSVVKRINVF